LTEFFFSLDVDNEFEGLPY